jgi:hypothetical protein
MIVILLGFLISVQGAFCQVSEMQNSLAKESGYNLREKIYLHSDRSLYLCGEVLWFKAYLTSASNNRPLSISKVAYVEILNNEHQPVLQGKIAIKNATGSGSFYLPFSLATGNYELRAYTSWMKNFSPDHYFKKYISIINTTKSLDTAAIHEPVSYIAGFFPEGGNLVNGLESEIAFKVTDNRNKGIDCEGVLVDQQHDTILHFKTLQFGMGHFYLAPEAGKLYTTVITCKDGSVIRQPLPIANTAGYTMHVSDTGMNEINISVASAGLSKNSQPFVYIIFQNSGQVIMARTQFIENGRTQLIMNKDSLPGGINQITVFGPDKQPQCERLYFKRPGRKMLLTAKADKNNFLPRNKVEIQVTATDASGSALRGNLSAAVFRLDSLHQPDLENIYSYLWLSSNLKGPIEMPGYYLNNENAEINEALDNLLLTQGWRKFNEETNLQHERPSFKYIPEYGGHIITGRITDDATKKPAPGILVYLSVPGLRVQLKGCRSDSAGLIHFDMKDFYGANQIVVQTNTSLDSGYHIEIFSPFSEEYSGNVLPSFDLSSNKADNLRAGNFDMQVQNGYHDKDIQSFENPAIDTLPFYDKPFKTYLLDNYTRFTTMEEVMREYVQEVGVRRKGNDFRFVTFNAPAFALRSNQPYEQTMFDVNPLVLLDGVPVFDINKIIAYDPLKVQKLEVVASKYYYGPIVSYGIVSYTTYKGNLDSYTLNPNDLLMDYDGLQKQRIFYSPVYATDKELQSPLPDFRDVLYWSPEISTNEKGSGFFSFYTGDIPGKYFVDIQGIAPNGEAGSTGFILDVVK